MSLEERAVRAYREARAEERKLEEQQASQFLDRASRWVAKTFGDSPRFDGQLAPDTPTQAIGVLAGRTCRIVVRYQQVRLELEDACPNCHKVVWYGNCRTLEGLGRALAEHTDLVKLCGCKRKRERQPDPEERLARAFVDLVHEISGQ